VTLMMSAAQCFY